MSDGQTTTIAIVRALARAEGVEVNELTYSLHEYVATEAITTLVESGHESWELTFEVPGHVVTLTGDGVIKVDGEIDNGRTTVQSEER